MTEQKISREKICRYANALILYEMSVHHVDPRKTLDGTTLCESNNEGYKRIIAEQWGERPAGKSYVTSLKEMLSKTNLVSFYQVNGLHRLLEDNGPERLEAALDEFFKATDEAAAFEMITNTVGSKFDLVSFLFFLKDPVHYVPVRSRLFDARLAYLGIDSKLTRNCTWAKYRDYICWVEEVKDVLKEHVNLEISLIDAHSFLWILPGLDAYLNQKIQKVYHRDYGFGTVTGLENNIAEVKFKNSTELFPIAAFSLDKGKLRVIGNTFDIYKCCTRYIHPDRRSKKTNGEMDYELECALEKGEALGSSGKAEFKGGFQPRKQAHHRKNGSDYYPRDPRVAWNALTLENHQCVCDREGHKSFKRKNSDIRYMEAHHLVGMAYQGAFDVCLDREENIVSLCSDCHNRIHYGKDAHEIVRKLYEARKERLESIGVNISLDDLLKMY